MYRSTIPPVSLALASLVLVQFSGAQSPAPQARSISPGGRPTLTVLPAPGEVRHVGTYHAAYVRPLSVSKRLGRPFRTRFVEDLRSGVSVHGLLNAVFVGSMPIDLSVATTAALNFESRSRIKYRGAVSKGNASRSCWMTHEAVGWAVTLTWRICRRPWWSTKKT